MTLYGKVVVIRRTGADGAKYPLLTDTCLFGRSNDCDIRIQLLNVAKEHCRLNIHKSGEIFLTNLTTENPTILNNIVLSYDKPVKLHHKDIFTIIDRSFRLEFPDGSPQCEETLETSQTPPKLQDKLPAPKSSEKSTMKITTPKTKPPIISNKVSPELKRSPEQKRSPESKRSVRRPSKSPELAKKVPASALSGAVGTLNKTPKSGRPPKSPESVKIIPLIGSSNKTPKQGRPPKSPELVKIIPSPLIGSSNKTLKPGRPSKTPDLMKKLPSALHIHAFGSSNKTPKPGRPSKSPELMKNFPAVISSSNKTPKTGKILAKENWSDTIHGKRKSLTTLEDLAPDARGILSLLQNSEK